MKISLNWLNDYLDLKDYYKKSEELGALLTRAGLEVEGIQDLSESFKNIKVGYVKELKKHPNADKLTLCQVDLGEETLSQIVCGAQNHKQGDFVVVATPGAVLPGDFKIKKSKIRGEESFGMMCSEKELGLAEDSEGILILPEGSPVGQDFGEYSKLNDVVFELSVTPNRADCLSHWGLARELSTLLGRECRFPKKEFKTSHLSTKKQIDFYLKNSELCPRYSGRSIRNIKVGPSPQWLKSRLESVDVNSINNVVDVTNYILMELGQPLHAFDVDKVNGRKITVDSSLEGEKFQTLDGTEVVLTGEELVIRDGEKTVALAGVVGGLNSGVSDETTELFIESAYFLQKTVRRASRKFGIETDSSYRFSRGIDPDAVIKALNRACELIQEVAGGEVSEDYYDEYPNPVIKNPIQISKSFVEDKMGYKIKSSEFENWMTRLGCEIEGNEKSWQVKTPAFRWDLNDDVDLVEEFARLNGYENIPETLPELQMEPTAHEGLFFNSNLVQSYVISEGYSQAMNYHFTSSTFTKEFLGDVDKISKLGVNTCKEMISVQNPLNEDLDVMRVSLVPGLFNNLLHNVRYGQLKGRLFELGTVFSSTSSKDLSFSEPSRLSLLAWGREESMWQKGQDFPVVYELKTHVENVLQKLDVSHWEWRSIDEPPEYLHPGQCSSLFMEGKYVGYIGTLHPKWSEENKVRASVAFGDFDFDAIMKNYPRKFKFKNLSKFPTVERDIAFLVPDSVSALQVIKEITRAVKSLLKSVDVFDIYKGKNLPEGYSSMAFKMILQNEEATLEEKQLQALQDKVISAVKSKLNIDVR